MIMGVNNIGQFFKSPNSDNVRKTEGAKKQQDGSGAAERVNVKNSQEVQGEEVRESPRLEVKDAQTKAFFAVTENKDVVIRIVDSEGNLIRQIPPEEFLKTAEFLQSNNKNIFSVEV